MISFDLMSLSELMSSESLPTPEKQSLGDRDAMSG